MISILKYNAGNTASVQNAVVRLGFECQITDNPQLIKKSDKVIFPGVGHALTAMNYLKERKLDVLIKELEQPVLGICLGMQLMCNYLEEGNLHGLGIFNADVLRFPPADLVPHMGWNGLTGLKGTLFEGVTENSDVYFVHSYYAGLTAETVAQCDYIQPFSAALQKNNFYAVQFHPEKSAAIGEQILKNFLSI
ncbi:MAG: imidazole glycerol phosphate synthase subunit HisH [Capnocytophaga sp.]|nr:imidazole glycerol phosphate synthase subunit HisH [Capnocytophaga sp.]